MACGCARRSRPGTRPTAAAHARRSRPFPTRIPPRGSPAPPGAVGARGTFTTINPATGEVLAELPVAGPEEIERAVRAARQAQRSWAALTGAERGRILRRAAELLRARNEELARLETCDT